MPVQELGLKVDSSGVKQGVVDLDALVPAAERAEAAAQKLGDSSSKAFSQSSQGAQAWSTQMQQAANDANSLQARINQSLNIGAGTDTAARSADIIAYGKSLDDLRAKYNPLFAAEQQHKKTVDEINSAVRVGALTQVEANTAIAAAESAFKRQTGAVNDNAHAHMNLSMQAMAAQHAMRSTVEMLAQGVPITQVIGMHINELSYAMSGQGGLIGALKEGASAFSFLLNPLVIGGAALAAFGGAALLVAHSWDSSETEIKRALSGIGAASGATVEDINAIADASSRSGQISLGNAMTVAAGFAATGKIYRQNIGDLTDMTAKFAQATGQGVVAAGQELAKAFADPTAGAQKLTQQLGFLDGKTLEHIRTLEDAGNEEAAQRTLIDSLTSSISKADRATGEWSITWSKFWNDFKSGLTDIGGGIDTLFGNQTDQQKMGNLMSEYAQLAQHLQELRGMQKNAGWFNAASIDAQVEGTKNKIGELISQITALQTKLNEQKQAALEKQLNGFSTAADNAVRSAIPAIAKIDDLNKAIAEVQKAQANPAIAAKQGLAQYDQQTLDILKQQDAAANEAKNLELLRTAAVEKLREAYGGVSVAVAQSLQHINDQINLADALTGQQKMQVQYAIDYRDALLKVGDATEAELIAQTKLELSQANIDASVQNQVKALEQQTALIKARQDGAYAEVSAAQAYQNAIDAGASTTEAAALEAATLAKNMADATNNAVHFGTAAKAAVDSFASGLSSIGSTATTQGWGQGGTLVPYASMDPWVASQVQQLQQTDPQLWQTMFGTAHYQGVPFAEGGVMTGHGPLQLKKYAGGGIATSPQVSIFGEGSTPEAYVPLKSGAIPVQLTSASNGLQGVTDALTKAVQSTQKGNVSVGSITFMGGAPKDTRARAQVNRAIKQMISA